MTAYSDLQESRKPDYKPCAAKCRKCSRCLCSWAYHRRGRPYLGIVAEAALRSAR